MKDITQFCILAILILVIVGVSAEALNVNRTIPFNTTKVNTSVKPSNSTPVDDSVEENITEKPPEENITEEVVEETPPEKTYEEKLEEKQLEEGSSSSEEGEVSEEDTPAEEDIVETPEELLEPTEEDDNMNTPKEVEKSYTTPNSASSKTSDNVVVSVINLNGKVIDNDGKIFIGKNLVGYEVEGKITVSMEK